MAAPMPAPTTFEIVSSPGADADRRLAGWRENVGQPVAIDRRPGVAGAAPSMARLAPALAVLSWNVWIGRGRLVELVRRIRTGHYTPLGITPDLPFVALVQEAYRADESIPLRSNGWAPREITSRARPQADIVDAARELDLDLRYAPSMRNGATRTDRGNAILSSLPLCDARGLELPLVFQRRVAVTAAIELNGRWLRLVSAHLDPRGPPDHRWLGAAGRAQHTAQLVNAIADDTVLFGADLNLSRGRRERTWRLLAEAEFTFGVPGAEPRWRHTYHALPRLVLDYVMIRNRRRAIASAAIHRIDEDARDRGPTVFGSDHHPLLARVELVR